MRRRKPKTKSPPMTTVSEQADRDTRQPPPPPPGLRERIHGWLRRADALDPTFPLTTAQVLHEEAKAIHGVDPRSLHGEPLYRFLNRLDQSALCLSGGGIRSAAFALGVIQALAAHPRTQNGDPVDAAEDLLLAKFHYLSTVSGGGYVGSWLSAWRARVPFETLWRNLIGRPDGPDSEPPTIAWLRSYSNYLTPQLGLLSADTWAIVAVYVRNLLVNWVVILPVLCASILALKFAVVALTGLSRINFTVQPRFLIVATGVLFLLVSLSYTTRNRPSRRGEGAEPPTARGDDADQTFLRGSLIWTLAGGRGVHAVSRGRRCGSVPPCRRRWRAWSGLVLSSLPRPTRRAGSSAGRATATCSISSSGRCRAWCSGRWSRSAFISTCTSRRPPRSRKTRSSSPSPTTRSSI